jgi:hypothetical protein
MGIGMSYALDVEKVAGKSVLWNLNSSNLINYNKGGWKLRDLGDGSTLVEYGCDVELKASVPTFVTKFVLGQAFPKMLRTFSKYVLRPPLSCLAASPLPKGEPLLRAVSAAPSLARGAGMPRELETATCACPRACPSRVCPG